MSKTFGFDQMTRAFRQPETPSIEIVTPDKLISQLNTIPRPRSGEMTRVTLVNDVLIEAALRAPDFDIRSVRINGRLITPDNRQS